MRVGVVVVAALLLFTACGSPVGPEGESGTAPSAPASPRYSIIGQKVHSDGRTNYYVVVDAVDLSNDGFKQRVKAVLQAVARTNGDPEFVARVYDDRGAAEWAWSAYEDVPESCEIGGPCGTRPPIPADADERNRADEQSKAEKHASDRHVVAFYSGGAKSDDDEWPYGLAWYPFLSDEVTDTGGEVNYEGHERWRPLPDPTTPPSVAPTVEPLNGTFYFVKHYGRDETWTIHSTCDAASGDCAGEVSFSDGGTAPIRREAFGPWTVDRVDAENGWDCGLRSSAEFPGRKADIHYSWGVPANEPGTVTWVAPRGTCMPGEMTYETTFGLKGP
jgi:hypothetical protein